MLKESKNRVVIIKSNSYGVFTLGKTYEILGKAGWQTTAGIPEKPLFTYETFSIKDDNDTIVEIPKGYCRIVDNTEI